MPIYEYECGRCKRRSEAIQGFDAPNAWCIDCRVEMTRLISVPAGILFKGEGFPGNDMKKARRE